MGKASDKREKILEYLNEYAAEHGYAPSVREICAAVGLRSTASVSYHLGELERQGFIRTDGTKKRAIALPERPGKIPLVGVVTAGMPILAVENIEDYIPWEGESGNFALRIRGDSMIGAGILDGDLVIVRPQQTAQNGEIVIALLGEEATCKRFHQGKDGVWLMPENPAYPPIDGSEAVILGKVRGLMRQDV